MKKYASALALAALIGAPASQALETTFGGEYEMNGYTHDRVAAGADDVAAFQQLLRLKIHNKTDSGVQINARVNLSNSTWEGDGLRNQMPQNELAGRTQNDFAQGEFSTRATETVTMDYAYISVPLGGSNALTVGRVTSDWPACFLVCEDRRDRFIFSTKVGAHTILPIYTHKAEGATTNDADDLSDAQVVALGPLGGGWSYFAALAYHFTGKSNNLLNNVWLVSPYVKGKVGPVDIQVGYTGATGGDDSALLPVLGEGWGFSDNIGHAFFTRAGATFGMINVEAQVAMTIDGGLMSGGFDSFSQLISNNPTQNRNPVSQVNMGGGLGRTGYDEMLLAARVNVTPMEKVKVTAAIGTFEQDTAAAAPAKDTMFVDLQASYKLTADTTAWVGYSRATGGNSAGDLFADDVSAMTLNLRTVF